MAPPRTASEPSDSYNQERQDFLAKLQVFHEKRGTNFDPDPRVGSKHIDLYYLYRTVLDRGGYDRVSDEKLAWRKLGQDFNLGANNLPALAFALKTVYYKQLAAYEIATVHGKEPPPKEILEDTTAKGGSLLTRTLENFRPSTRRETGALGNENSEASGDDGTPVRDRNESEETPGSGGRVTRGLRQAPPQRVLFQPDTQSSRQSSRHASATSHPPSSQQQHHQQGPRGASTFYNPASNSENASATVANFEPRPQVPLTLRPVITPGNNPKGWSRIEQARKMADGSGGGGGSLTAGRLILPGSGFDGPNIYVRCLCALKSGIRAEQDYALHHLVKISMERGDKYRFESFPGLAEALIERLLEVGSLFYEVNWQVSYMEDGSMPNISTLNGLYGTKDILQRIARLPRLDVDDNIHTEEFSRTLELINEAALTMRNMVLLEENALYVSELYPLRDFLSIALNLPNLDCVVELKHHALDIAEQLTKYMSFDETDPLYISLLAQLQSSDRGAILTSLRAISRISMNLEENNLLTGVPVSAVQNIMDWLLLNDEDLVSACLDFLYQYTAVVHNVDFMITNLQVEPLINQLIRLLGYGARMIEAEQVLGHPYKKPAPDDIAPLPQELQAQLEKLDEPERSSHWLRCLFEEDRDESITQIAMWQAYQARFTPMALQTGRPLLPAAEFIKNVSSTFAEKASAQVQSGPVQKFIIKGIRRRSVPVDFRGEEFHKCLWKTYGSTPCGEFFMDPVKMQQHILRNHLGATQLENGQFRNTVGQYVCHWDGCRRFHDAPAQKLAQLDHHIKVHLPPPPTLAAKHQTEKPKPSYMVPAPKKYLQFQVTMTDDRNDAAGIPLSAVLVLRNLARNLSKTETEENASKQGDVSWVDRLFKPVEPRLFEVMSHNRSLLVYIVDLLSAIRDS